MKIRDVNTGDVLLGYYALTKCDLVPFTGGVRLQLEMADSTGRIAGVMWGEDAEQSYPTLKDASVVKIKGVVSSYRGQNQVQVEKIRPAKVDEYDASELLASSEFSLEELEAGIEEMVNLVTDEELHQLVVEALYDEDVKRRYFESPAGTRWHHGYLRGLAEHSLSMARLAAKVCEHYPYLDQSLLISGALLHDIGKITELEIGATFEYSVDGRLFGHMVIGFELVKSTAERLGLQGDVNVKKLLHMILSHQGKKEYSAPVEPEFEEAFVLYFIDELDSKLNAIARIRSKPENEGRPFSDWVQLLGGFLYLEKKATDHSDSN
ncbi:MAG: HD domain-containing protein [Candidatus Zixiibacteriota bacterium]